MLIRLIIGMNHRAINRLVLNPTASIEKFNYELVLKRFSVRHDALNRLLEALGGAG